MNTDLYRLVYVSRNLMASGREFQQGVEKVLERSRKNNEAASITGALMFNAGCFAQILEGQQQAIEQTYERIVLDERHEHPRILFFEKVDARDFESWSMAYIGEDSDSLAAFAGMGASTGFESARLEGERLYQIMQQHLSEADGDRQSICR